MQADSEALLVLCQLMRLRDAPAKQHLQRVLSNLCVHSETRAQLFRILMAMLRPDSQAQERSEPPDLSQEAPAGPASLEDALQVRSSQRDAQAMAVAVTGRGASRSTYCHDLLCTTFTQSSGAA